MSSKKATRITKENPFSRLLVEVLLITFQSLVNEIKFLNNCKFVEGLSPKTNFSQNCSIDK
ncbi:MAG: hypothetical protein HeimC3_13720 [Candidatus Heimdallarchaeota archaeon LC_3]|nr:MAG: hypothetical protein HeimC3_13720 [Candidatus Heimdallarchaeota archaeon LC_3]